jgi:hypothetical protein
MKIEVLTTIKGHVGEMFFKGDVFEDPNIPRTLMEELGENRGLVRVIDEADIAPIEIPVEAPPTFTMEILPVEEVPVKVTRSHKRIVR